MSSVQQMLQAKKGKTHTIAPSATVFEALQLMADKDIGAVIVVDKEKVVGIFSERDYARKVALKGRASKTMTVRELMTRGVYYVTPTHSVEQCMGLMTDKHVRHLPVLENGKLVGVVSIGDVVKTLITDQKILIEQLESYITGDYT
jgi:CBS domain-containing protein